MKVDTPKRRVGDNVPWQQRPTTILYFILVLVVLAVVSVVFSAVSAYTSQDIRDYNTSKAAINAARNQVQILRHRVRQEEGTECITRYLSEIMRAVVERRQPPLESPCPAQNISVLQQVLLDAEKSLRELSPNDPLLLTGQDEHGVDYVTSTTAP